MGSDKSCSKIFLLSICLPVLWSFVVSSEEVKMNRAQDIVYSVYFAGDSLQVVIDGYHASFYSIERASFTIREVRYGGQTWLSPTGAMQPVLLERDISDTIKDAFLGTGHRLEKIDELRLVISYADGTTQVEKFTPEMRLEGKASAVSVKKKSRFISESGGFFYSHESLVTVKPDGIEENYRFKAADGDMSKVRFMYAFMHCFAKSSKYWIAGNDKGEVIDRGEFKSDRSFTLNKTIRWVIVYDPEKKLGTVYAYPETYEGEAKFWNRTGDKKLYLTVHPPKKEGEEARYQVRLEVFEVGEEKWEAMGRKILEKYVQTTETTNKETGCSGQ